MKNNFIFMCLAIGMLSNGFYNDAFAVNATEQTAEIQKRVLTEEDAARLIKEMKARGSTELVIPEEEEYTSISYWAFEGCTGLTSIVIPDSVTEIGYNAFKGCDKAKFIVPYTGMKKYLHLHHGISEDRIEVTQNANQTNAWAWNDDGNIIIPEGTVSISDNMFNNREDIKSITIPDSVTSIGESAFERCTGLTSIVIPDSVMSIGEYAFCGCEGLTSIVIPDSVTSIGNRVFPDCTGLTSIVIPDGVTFIGDESFFGCEGLTSITIPGRVTSIGDWAFCRCTGLTSIVIPDSVTEIGCETFLACENLNKVFVYSDRVKQLIIDSKSEIDHDIIEIIEKPENE